MIGQPDEDQNQPNRNAEVSGPAVLEESLRSAVSERVGATRFALWFGGKVRFGLNREGDVLVVRVPDPFFRDWIERHYAPTLASAVEEVVGRKLGVSVQIQSDSETPAHDVAQTPPADGGMGSPPESPQSTLPVSTKANDSTFALRLRPGRPFQVDRPGQAGATSTDGRLILPEASHRPAAPARRLRGGAGKPRRTRGRHGDGTHGRASF